MTNDTTAKNVTIACANFIFADIATLVVSDHFSHTAITINEADIKQAFCLQMMTQLFVRQSVISDVMLLDLVFFYDTRLYEMFLRNTRLNKMLL